MYVSPAGAIANVLWHEIKNHAKNIELGEFVVMPNHIHGILILNGNDVGGRDDDGCGDVDGRDDDGRDVACNVPTTTDCNGPTMGNVPTMKCTVPTTTDCNVPTMKCNVPTMKCIIPTTTDCNIPTMGNDPTENDHILGTDIANDRFRGDVACNVPTMGNIPTMGNVRTSKNEFMAAISPKSNTVSAIIRSYKSAVTKYCNRLELPIAWQSRFHDHIIRNDQSFQRISKYINDNPMNWPEDQFFK